MFSKTKYDYLSPLNIESIFVTPADSTEVPKIISSLNQDKNDVLKIRHEIEKVTMVVESL